MRHIFKRQVDTTAEFSAAMEQLEKRTTPIRALDLVQSYIQDRCQQAATSPNVIELKHRRQDVFDEQWQEKIDFDKYVEIARALGRATSAVRIITNEADAPYDYEADETVG